MTTMNRRRLGDDQPIEEIEPPVANIPTPDLSRRFNTTSPEPENDSEQPQATTLAVAPEPDARLIELQKENERLRQLINASADARNHAREFMTLYADPRRLPDLERLLYQMLPNAKQLGLAGAKLVARLAVAYQLNPFVEGMVWAYTDDHVIRVRIGYAGWLEKMHQQGHLEVLEPRPMTEEERQQHGLKPDERGSVVEVYDLAAMQRYQKYGIPNYRPKVGIGTWRPDEKKSFVPVGRSGKWRSEIRAINDAGKRTVRLPLEDLARFGEIGAAFDEENTTWSVEADPPADWTQSPEAITKAENYLKTIGLTDAEVNEALGMTDWRFTWLNAQDWKEMVDGIARQRKEEAINGTFTAPVSEESTPAGAAPESSIPAETIPEPTVSTNEPVVAEKTEPEPVQPGKAAKKEKPPVPDSAPKQCINCGLEPAIETPLGLDYCETCANRKANAQVADLGK